VRSPATPASPHVPHVQRSTTCSLICSCLTALLSLLLNHFSFLLAHNSYAVVFFSSCSIHLQLTVNLFKLFYYIALLDKSCSPLRWALKRYRQPLAGVAADPIRSRRGSRSRRGWLLTGAEERGCTTPFGTPIQLRACSRLTEKSAVALSTFLWILPLFFNGSF